MLLRNRLLGGALFAGLLFGAPEQQPVEPASGGGSVAKKSRPLWVVAGKVFDDPWVAQKYLASITPKPAPESAPVTAPIQKPPAQFLVVESDRVEVDLTRFTYADELAHDSIEAHMELARIIIDERDMQIATLMAIAMLDD
jgi:hypothetical protein